MSFHRLLFTFFVALIFSNVSAQPVVRADSMPFENIGKYLSVLKDPTGALQFEHVVKHSDSFLRSNAAVPNYKISNAAYWIQFHYINSAESRLVIDKPNIDSVSVFIPQPDGSYQVFKSVYIDDEDRARPVMLIELPETNIPRTVYIRMRSSNVLLMPIKVATEHRTEQALEKRTIFESTYAALLLLLTCISIIFFIRTRDKLYLWYSGYIVFLMLYVIWYLRGYSHLFTPALNGLLADYAFSLAFIGYVFAALFARQLLTIDKRFPRCRFAIQALIGLIVVAFFMSLIIGRKFGVPGVQLVGIIECVTLLSCGFVLYRKGVAAARYYVLAWGVVLTSLSYTMMSYQGWVPFTDMSFQAIPFGSAVEVCFLCVAVGDRITRIEKHNEVLQKQSVRELETMVEAKTSDLQLMLQTMQADKTAKDDLFRIVMHDVRSPVANIYQMLQLFEKGSLSSDELNEYMPLLKTDTGRVLDNMGMLLQWAMLQKEGSTSNFEELQLLPLLKDHAALYFNLCKNKNIDLRVSCNSEAKVFADKNHLSLVLRNLIDNALKFTPKGGTIKIHQREEEKGDRIVIFNTAQPMSDAMIEEIQQRSGLHLSTGTSKEKGVGLGLQLCREFLTKMNSKLEVKNTEGGVEFSFVLV